MDRPTLLSEYDENLYLGYPHSNQFTDDGRALVLGQRTPDEILLLRHDLGTGQRQRLCAFARHRQPAGLVWAEAALTADRLAVVADGGICVLDGLRREQAPRWFYRPPEGGRLDIHSGLRGDGEKVVCSLQVADRYQILEIDVETSSSEVLFEKDWWLDHTHYCPFDPAWIGCSHEGDCATVPERVWGWHRQEAPAGRVFFDQSADQPGRELYAGHERWSFHDRSVYVVAYGASPGRPRGVYESFADGRPQRLISEGDRDLHLNVSQDGRWIAIDTSGPHDLAGKGWENAEGVSDVLVVDRQSGERRFVARSHLGPHPAHPHPVFSPDGRHLYFNEAEPGGTRHRVWRAENPLYS